MLGKISQGKVMGSEAYKIWAFPPPQYVSTKIKFRSRAHEGAQEGAVLHRTGRCQRNGDILEGRKGDRGYLGDQQEEAGVFEEQDRTNVDSVGD